VRERVPYVFGMCGHGDLGMLDALYDRADEITTISVNHESVAGFMADAYFRVRHEPVATLTAGEAPVGALDHGLAILDLYSADAPVLGVAVTAGRVSAALGARVRAGAPMR
jgi:thiamine pyrophosphate-dependent acetolactate synthase large subunit-like protein